MHREITEALLTPQEVSVLLRVAVSTVYSAATNGRLPAVRIWRGRRKSLLRFRRDDVEQLMREGSPTRSGPKKGEHNV